jgi:hypothetical protein
VSAAAQPGPASVGAPARAGLPAMDAHPVGDLGLLVSRELLAEVAEEHRERYLRAVAQFAAAKYQLGVEVARRLPPLLADEDPEVADRFLAAMAEVGAAGWRTGVEAARYLPLLQSAPDPALADGYVETIVDANHIPVDSEDTAAEEELADLEAGLDRADALRARADAIRTLLARRRQGDERRSARAVDLAAILPVTLARLRRAARPAYLQQVHLVALADSDAALAAAESLADLLNSERVSTDGAAEWVARGLEVLDRNRDIGRGYFRLSSKQAFQVLDELKEGLSLKSVGRVLKLYATALSGQEVAIRATDELHAVDAFGAEHIVLPPEMRMFEDDATNFVAYKVATAHGAGRIEFGTYGFRLDDISDTVERLEFRYGQGRK